MILAAVEGGPLDTTAVLLTYGPLGVFAVLAVIAFRVIWKRFNEFMTREQARADSAQEDLQELHAKVIDQVTPALTRATDVTTRATETLAAVLAEMQRRDRR